MRKINLDVDALEVDSFDTVGDEGRERGTVHGQGWYSQVTCPRTQCGAECPSGAIAQCELSYAWTDGQMACMCAQGEDTLGCP